MEINMPKDKSERIIYLVGESAQRLSVSLFSACRCHVQESVIRKNGAPFYQILAVLDGVGKVRVGNNEYPLHRGTAFYVGKDVPVEYINDSGLLSAFVTAVGEGVERLAESYGITDFLYSDTVSAERYKSEVDRIVGAYSAGEKDGRISALTYSFFADFFDNGKRTLDKAEEALLYIDRNFDKRLNLFHLAESVSSSVSGLCHSFKEKYGRAVIEYLNERRLMYAKKLLVTEEDLSVKEIAVMSGFEDASYFCRVFKKRYGHSPTEERNIYKNT